MPPSWRLAFNNLARRPGRTFLMVGAVGLAAALIVAVSCAINSVRASLEQRLTRFVGASDARIIHPAAGRFSDGLLQTVGEWPEVARATGRLTASLSLERAGEPTEAEVTRRPRVAVNAIGVDFSLEPRFRQLDLTAGAMPESPDEVVLDPMAAERLGVQVGDHVTIPDADNAPNLRVAAVYHRQQLGLFQQSRAYLDRALLMRLGDHPGQLTSIQIILHDEEDVEAFCRRHEDQIPQTLSLEPAEMVRTGFNRRIRGSEVGLRIGTVLTFMSAAFIIVTGMTTGITERQREMALLRCLGAYPGHLFHTQLILGLLFGALGAIVGIPLGLGLAQLLVASFDEFLVAGLTIHRAGIVLALIGSLAAGLFGAIYPAVTSSRVPPLQAMTRQALPVRPISIVACAAAGAALIGAAILLGLPGDGQHRFWTYAVVGLPIAFLGWFLLGVPALVAVTYLLAPPLAALLRLPRDMLRGSMLTTPFRHGFTAGALMLGMAILVDAWACGISLLDDWIAQIRFADGFAARITGISPDEQQAIADLPFVDEVCPIGRIHAEIADRQIFGIKGISPPNVVCVGFDAERFFRMNRMDWAQGDPETAIPRLISGEGLIVADRFLTAKNIGVGEKLGLRVGRVTHEFEIVGVVGAAGLDIASQIFGIQTAYTEFALSCVFIDHDVMADVFDSRDIYLLQINLASDITDEEAARRIAEAAPGTFFRSGRWIKDTINEIMLGMLAVQSTVAFVALALASLAVGNVLAAHIHGRRYEFGVFRAAGAGRSTVLRLIMAEAAILAMTAATVGTAFGFHLAGMDVRLMHDLAGLPVRIGVPLGPIALGCAVLLALSLLAAVPSALGVLRHRPSALLAVGRND